MSLSVFQWAMVAIGVVSAYLLLCILQKLIELTNRIAVVELNTRKD
jgi:hypothetical protein